MLDLNGEQCRFPATPWNSEFPEFPIPEILGNSGISEFPKKSGMLNLIFEGFRLIWFAEKRQ